MFDGPQYLYTRIILYGITFVLRPCLTVRTAGKRAARVRGSDYRFERKEKNRISRNIELLPENEKEQRQHNSTDELSESSGGYVRAGMYRLAGKRRVTYVVIRDIRRVFSIRSVEIADERKTVTLASESHTSTTSFYSCACVCVCMLQSRRVTTSPFRVTGTVVSQRISRQLKPRYIWNARVG